MELSVAAGSWGLMLFALLLRSGVYSFAQVVFFGALPVCTIVFMCADELAPFIGLVPKRRVKEARLQERQLTRPMETGADSLEWLNLLIDQLWPHVAEYLEGIIRSYESTIQSFVPVPVHFKTCSLGTEPMKLGHVKPRLISSNFNGQVVENGGLQLDIPVTLASNVDIRLAAGVASIGVADLKIDGTLNVCFRPLLSNTPFIGGLEVLFINPPDVDLNFHGIGHIAELPGIHGVLYKVIHESIANLLVVPNRLAFPIAGEAEVDLACLKNPTPEGVLRITVVKAENLEGADIPLLGGARTSDPYVIITVGGKIFKTPTIMKTCNPIWTEKNVDDFPVYSLDQLVQVDVFDWDRLKADDPLGSIKRWRVQEVIKSAGRGPVPMELEARRETDNTPPEDARLYLQIEWLRFTQTPNEQTSGKEQRNNLNKYALTFKVDECTGLTEQQHNAPFTVRLSVKGNEQNEASTSKGRAKDFEPASAEMLDRIRRLSSRGVEDHLIADVMGIDLSLIKELFAEDQSHGVKRLTLLGDRERKALRDVDKKWLDRMQASLVEREQTCNPQFEEVLLLFLPSKDVTLVVELIDDPAKRRKRTLTMSTSKTNSQLGVVARFEVELGNNTVLHGPFTWLDQKGNACGVPATMPAKLHGTFTLWSLQPTTGSYSMLPAGDLVPHSDGDLPWQSEAADPVSDNSPRAVPAEHPERLALRARKLRSLKNKFKAASAFLSGHSGGESAETEQTDAARIESVVENVHGGDSLVVYDCLKNLASTSDWDMAKSIFEQKYSSADGGDLIAFVEKKLAEDDRNRLARKLHAKGIGDGIWPPRFTAMLGDFLYESGEESRIGSIHSS